MKWTSEQKSIIEAPLQNICVLASAGSGKTFVIVERVARLIEDDGLKAADIAVITFTNLAADSVSKRLAKRLARDGLNERVYSGTIHSFCIKLLKEFDPARAAKLQILTPGKQFALLFRKFEDWRLQECSPSETRKSELISRVVRTFDYLNLKSCDRKKLAQTAASLNFTFEQYEIWCSDNSHLDFSSILSEFVQKLADPAFFKFVVSRVRYLIIDEYQDTDDVQEQLVVLLSKSIPIMVVGDDDQCIYQFRGTSPKNIMTFVTRIENAVEMSLSCNFRCGSNIVSLASAAVSLISDRKTKTLVSDWAGGQVTVETFADVAAEAANIAAQVSRLKASGKIQSYSDVALLFRSVASHSAPYIDALRSRDIPVIVRGDRGLFERPEVLACMGLLEVLVAAEAALHRVSDLSIAIGLAITIPDNWQGPSNFDEFGPEDWYSLSVDEGTVGKIEAILRLRQTYLDQRFSNILELVIGAGSILSIFNEGRPQHCQRNFALITQIAKEYDEVVGGKNLKSFINYLRVFAAKNYDAADTVIEGEEAVSVLTVHQSKGLEFEAVFIPMLVDKRFPLEDSSQPILLDKTIFDLSGFRTSQADERRIFYVAATRAKSRLFLSAARDVGLVREKAASTFFREAIPYAEPDAPVRVKEATDPARKMLSLSYSKIEYYLSCPHRYYLLYDIGIATPQNPFFAFGQLIHLVLRMAHDQSRSGQSIKEADLIEFYDENFPVIYSVPKLTLEAMRRRGRVAIAKYVGAKRQWLEDTRETELPFVFSKTLTTKGREFGLELNGQIDLIVGDETTYEIVDFKTGKPHAYIQTELQLQLYSSALLKHFGRAPRAANVYYVEEQKEVRYLVSPQWIEAGQLFLTKAASGIVDKTFTASPGQVCTRCEVSKVCQYRQ